MVFVRLQFTCQTNLSLYAATTFPALLPPNERRQQRCRFWGSCWFEVTVWKEPTVFTVCVGSLYCCWIHFDFWHIWSWISLREAFIVFWPLKYFRRWSTGFRWLTVANALHLRPRSTPVEETALCLLTQGCHCSNTNAQALWVIFPKIKIKLIKGNKVIYWQEYYKRTRGEADYQGERVSGCCSNQKITKPKNKNLTV